MARRAIALGAVAAAGISLLASAPAQAGANPCGTYNQTEILATTPAEGAAPIKGRQIYTVTVPGVDTYYIDDRSYILPGDVTTIALNVIKAGGTSTLFDGIPSEGLWVYEESRTTPNGLQAGGPEKATFGGNKDVADAYYVANGGSSDDCQEAGTRDFLVF